MQQTAVPMTDKSKNKFVEVRLIQSAAAYTVYETGLHGAVCEVISALFITATVN
jgi:hypothetical protein